MTAVAVIPDEYELESTTNASTNTSRDAVVGVTDWAEATAQQDPATRAATHDPIFMRSCS